MADQSKNKHRKRRKRNYKKDLFLHYKQILILLLENKREPFHKNKIAEILSKKVGEKHPTGRMKNQGLRTKENWLDTIKTFHKDLKLVSIERKTIEREKRIKDIVTLTDIGCEIAEVVSTIDKYDKSYLDLIYSYNEKLFSISHKYSDYIDKKLTQNDFPETPTTLEEVERLKINLVGEKGWKWEELEFFTEIRSNLIDLKNIIDRNYFFVVTRRFARIIDEHGLGSNSFLLDFIAYLIKESLEQRIDLILKNQMNEFYSRVTTKNYSIDDRIEISRDMSISIDYGIKYQLFEEIFSIFYKK
ncbi:hypothetical protein BH23THE1_BH23THE1_27530 [soil metagenome]